MLIANPMTPPRCPARAIATVIPAGAYSENSAARRLTPLPTYRPPGRFRPGGEHKADFQAVDIASIYLGPRRRTFRGTTDSEPGPVRVGKRRFGQAAV